MDLTPTFNDLLRKRDAPPAGRKFSFDELEDFLKEAYRIVCRAPFSFSTSAYTSVPSNTELAHCQPPQRAQGCPTSVPLHRATPQDAPPNGPIPAQSHRPGPRGHRRQREADHPRDQREHPDPRRRGAQAADGPRRGHPQEARRRARRPGELGGGRKEDGGARGG